PSSREPAPPPSPTPHPSPRGTCASHHPHSTLPIMAQLKTFRHITITRIELALKDLLTTRLPALQSFPYGAFVEVELKDLALQIKALPEEAKGLPFAAELAELDRTHDGYGRAAYYLV